MYTQDPQSLHSFSRLLGLLAASIFILVLFVWLPQPDPTFISPWTNTLAAPVAAAARAQQSAATALVIQATPDP